MLGLSIDLETLSANKTSAPVVEFAGIIFSVEQTKIKVLQHKFVQISPVAYEGNPNFTISPKTIQWWVETSGRNIKELFDVTDRPLYDAAIEIQNWFRAAKYNALFTRGDFDLPIISNLLQTQVGTQNLFLRIPYNNYHDVRTLHSIPRVAAKLPKLKNGLAHNALWDALHNIQVVAEAYELPLEFAKECLPPQFLPTTSGSLTTQSQLELPIDGRPSAQ